MELKQTLEITFVIDVGNEYLKEMKFSKKIWTHFIKLQSKLNDEVMINGQLNVPVYTNFELICLEIASSTNRIFYFAFVDKIFDWITIVWEMWFAIVLFNGGSL